MAHAPGPYRFSPSIRLHLSLLLERNGFVPLVATVASYVLGTADVIGGRLETCQESAATHLDLGPPGHWSATLEGRRLVTPPGNPWLWLTGCG
jgi:hypothetical protein